ncbi:MAG: CapA family protein, partial [Dolichospermum sp.]
MQLSFFRFKLFRKRKYDAWIGGIECPITTTYRNSATQDSDLKFSCPVEYTPEAAKWFDAFTIANNHTDNMEEVDGLEQTRQNLSKNGIQYFGHFDNAIKSDICEVVSFPIKYNYLAQTWTKVSVKDSTQASDVFYIPLAMCGFHNVFKLPTDDELAIVSQYSKYFPTIVMPHQGKEYSVIADQLQQIYAKNYIDLGADAVIGNHVHTVQNTGVYKQKLIVYSLGN